MKEYNKYIAEKLSEEVDMMQDSHYNDFRIPVEIKEQTNKVVRRLKSFGMEDFVNKELAEPSIYLLKSPGKLLRPTLVFLGAQYSGAEIGNYVRLATAVELLHTSSLIHDDIVDKDLTRRGLSAVHVKYGTENAILAGDALISKAIQEASPYGEKVINSISRAAMIMCSGEVLDYMYQKDRRVPGLSKYLEVAELKSSALIGTSAKLAAIHRTDGSEHELYDFGINLGTAFQIRDDVIDFFGIADKKSKDKSNWRLNAIRSIIKDKKVSPKEAVEIAKELNHRYIERAVKELNGKEDGMLLKKYASSVRL